MKERLPLILAVAATVVWLAIVAVYLAQLKWAGFIALDPTALATLLAASAGPLAALWLGMVVFEQSRIAAQLSRRLADVAAQERRTQGQAESLARAVGEIQSQAAGALAAETRRIAFGDLASSAAMLAQRLGVLKQEQAQAAWVRFSAGDVAVFVQAFLNHAGAHPDIAERIGEAVGRDPVARAALAAFVRRYEQVAGACGDDKMLRAIIEEGALGRGYRLFKQADSLAVREPAPAPPTADDSLRERLDGISRRLETVTPDAS